VAIDSGGNNGIPGSFISDSGKLFIVEEGLPLFCHIVSVTDVVGFIG
jgi:hypothetical protein